MERGEVSEAGKDKVKGKERVRGKEKETSIKRDWEKDKVREIE